jgi:hypothetical protein
MNETNLIHGTNICAMVNDNTSVKEMLQMMGVEPTDAVVNDAMNYCALNGNELTMDNLGNYLKQKEVLSTLKFNNKSKKIAEVVDLR